MTQGLAAPDSPYRIQAHATHDDVPSTTATSSTRIVGQPLAAPTASTLRLYASDWAGFVAWCRHHRRAFLPASSETLAAYLLTSAPAISRGALGRRRAAIGAMHRQADLAVPCLDAASRKALRTTAKPPGDADRTPAPTAASLVRIADRCPRDRAGLRDRALLLLAAATQCRARSRVKEKSPPTHHPRSVMRTDAGAEVPRLFLLELQAEDVRFTTTGAVLQLRTRTDEPVPSRTLTLTHALTASACPVRALEDWLRSSDTTFGPVFRKVDRWGNVEHARLGRDAWHGILARRSSLMRPQVPREPAS